MIARILGERFGFRLVVARDDGAARDFETLPRRKAMLVGNGPTLVRFSRRRRAVRERSPRRTPSRELLDQQENHAGAAAYAAPGMEALDAFAFHGGFALALARAGARVTALDESPAAVRRAQANAALNRLDVEVACVNAFDRLRCLRAAERRFDLIVIDPPALAKRAAPARRRARLQRAQPAQSAPAPTGRRAGHLLVLGFV